MGEAPIHHICHQHASSVCGEYNQYGTIKPTTVCSIWSVPEVRSKSPAPLQCKKSNDPQNVGRKQDAMHRNAALTEYEIDEN